MKKKIVVFLLVLALLPLAGVVAQTDGGPANSYTMLSFDIGYAPIFSLSGGDALEAAGYFGLNIRVADPLTVGTAIYTGNFAYKTPGPAPATITATQINLLKVKYDVIPMVRAVLGFGMNGGNFTPAGTDPKLYTDLGFEVLPFRRTIGGFSTEFKLTADYLFQPDNFSDSSLLVLGLVIGVGF